jgi:hypothetical protein
MADVQASFRVLYPTLSSSGVYIVEDLHTAYSADKGGGLGTPSSFIETCKGLIDELHAEHTDGRLPATEFTRSTLSVHFYDGLVVFERGRHLPGKSVVAGGIGRPNPSLADAPDAPE